MGPFDFKKMTILIDTREQRPFDFPSEIKTARHGLTTGDYSVLGYEKRGIALERKSLDDLAGCVGTHRDRFVAEIQRLLAYPVRGLIVEGTKDDIKAHNYRSRIHPNSILGSLLQWENEGIPISFCVDKAEAARVCFWKLRLAAQRKWEDARNSIANYKD